MKEKEESTLKKTKAYRKTFPIWKWKETGWTEEKLNESVGDQNELRETNRKAWVKTKENDTPGLWFLSTVNRSDTPLLQVSVTCFLIYATKASSHCEWVGCGPGGAWATELTAHFLPAILKTARPSPPPLTRLPIHLVSFSKTWNYRVWWAQTGARTYSQSSLTRCYCTARPEIHGLHPILHRLLFFPASSTFQRMPWSV